MKPSPYLSRSELAELVGCSPRSRSCMIRWLEDNEWPFEKNRAKVPMVARSYHDARMHGQALPSAAAANQPDFSHFQRPE